MRPIRVAANNTATVAGEVDAFVGAAATAGKIPVLVVCTY